MKTPFIITNSQDCRCILLEAGMLNELNAKPRVNTTSVTFRHAGYFWLAVNHTGHANPKDNGYTLIGLPEEIGEQETRLFSPDVSANGLRSARPWNLNPLPCNASNLSRANGGGGDLVQSVHEA